MDPRLHLFNHKFLTLGAFSIVYPFHTSMYCHGQLKINHIFNIIHDPTQPTVLIHPDTLIQAHMEYRDF